MRAAGVLPLVVLAASCGGPKPPAHVEKVTVTAVTPDAGAEASGSGSDDPGPPTAGTAEDVLGRVFELGTGPSVPTGFGALRPGMSRKDAKKARPKAWGEAWSAPASGEAGVTLSAGLDDASDDPVQRLTVSLVQRDAVARLTTAWGAPALTAYTKGMVCWLAAKSKLKACHTKDLDHDQVELVAYVPLADALAKGGPRTPAVASAHLGETKAQVAKAFAGAVELDDPDDHTQHRLEVYYPTSEMTAEVSPDRTVFYLDKAEKVVAIHLWFGANDTAVRTQVEDAVQAAVKQLKAGDDTLVTVRDEDQAAVVVVLDRTPGLR